MSAAFLKHLEEVLATIESDGLYKRERLIHGPQGGRVDIAQSGPARKVVNLCSNNYLGLANSPVIAEAAREALAKFGFGLASVRFICGTQTLHRELEQAVATYLQKDDAILFAACFDANGGVFEPLLGPEDAVISDSLNHASIIDGVRLTKCRRYRFENGNMNELEDRLKEAVRDRARFKLIATDGVFSMHGFLADLETICDLADRYDALVLVDDCHATGHLGAKGRGTPELTGVGSRVDIVTGTFGKSLGGGMGGFIAADQRIVDMLRQRARPYLFSNSLAPALAAGALKALELAGSATDLRATLTSHTRRFRKGLAESGFDLLPGKTPIIPVMMYDAERAEQMASALDERGVFVAGFSYPVVPKAQARIRTQMSAALTLQDVDFAIGAFQDAGKSLGYI